MPAYWKGFEITGERGPAGKDATINGVNTLTIKAGENVTTTQDGGVLTISAAGGGSGGNVYSTEETRIGTWINGKPIYRKVVNLTFTTASDILTVNIDALPPNTIDELINQYGYYHLDDGLEGNINSYYFGLYSKDNTWSVYQNLSSVTHTYTVKVIFEYTKTADPTPASQTTLLTSEVELPQSVTLSSQVAGLDSPVTVTFPDGEAVASASTSYAFASASSAILK